MATALSYPASHEPAAAVVDLSERAVRALSLIHI